MSRTIEILNPLDGCKKYMTMKRALDFVSRKVATIVDGKLLFTTENQRQRQEEMEFRKNRGDRVYWNGNSRNPLSTYRPGEKRS